MAAEPDFPIAEVMLLEDRAQITRRGMFTLSDGLTHITVPGVAPVLSDKSLTARILQGAQAQVCDARVVRFRKALREERPAATSELEITIEDALRELRTLQVERTRLEGQLAGIETIEDLVLQELKQDAAWNRDSRESVAEELDRLARESGALHAEHAALVVKGEVQRQNLRDLTAGIERLLHPSTLIGANLEVDIQSAAGGLCEIELSYVVPGACWRPWHTAERLAGPSPSVRIRSEACVWQNTGEDWKGVTLLFSTERPSLGVEPPVLQSDVIEARPKPLTVTVATREQTVQTTGLGTAVTETAELPGIDDGGDVFAIRSTAKADIPSDGRPYRVPYASFEASAETNLILMPELAPAVIRKTVQTNSGSVALLAGPVDLIGEGGYLGRTQVKLIAPSERFALGWGPENALRMHRELDKVDEESGLTGNMVTSQRTVTIQLSNIGAEEFTIRVTERVLVSEIEQVEVTVDQRETTQARTTDENGFVTWDVRLPPFGQESLRLVYRIRHRKDIVGI